MTFQLEKYLNKKIRLKSWKGDYLHRPDQPQGVTTWNTGVGNEWILEPINGGKVQLKSWKGDYLHRPDQPQGVTTWSTGVGNEWTIEGIHDGKIQLKSWKGDFLHRPDQPQGVTTWNTGVGNEWTIEAVDAVIEEIESVQEILPDPPLIVDPRRSRLKVRIINVKSGRYLSLQGDSSTWGNDDATLCIRDWIPMDRPLLESPQIWNIIQFRSNAWIIMNQRSAHLACIRARDTGNEAVAIQHHNQGIPFQHWDFVRLDNGNWLIKNINSGKCLGPQGRSTENGRHCIQYDDQTREDNYQEWRFEKTLFHPEHLIP